MEKNRYIQKLREELLKRGYDEKTVEAELIPVRGYFDERGIDDVTVPVDEMVEEIVDLIRPAQAAPAKEEPMSAEDEIESALKASALEESKPAPAEDEVPQKPLKTPKKKKAKKAAEPEQPTAEESTEQPREDESAPAADDVSASAAEKPVETPSADETAVEPAGTDLPEEDEEDDGDVIVAENGDFDPDEYAPDMDEGKVKLPEFIKRFLVGLKRGRKEKPAEDSEYSSDLEENYSDGKSKILFWIILIVCIPFLVLLAAVAVAIYMFFWLVLALLMIFIIAVLIAFVTAGATVSIIGIVYGVIQVIKGLTPVGLFEIGLGIVVASAVAFVGILVYNFAVRLIPFAMKMLAKLLGIVFRRTKEAFAAVRRTLNEA